MFRFAEACGRVPSVLWKPGFHIFRFTEVTLPFCGSTPSVIRKRGFHTKRQNGSRPLPDLSLGLSVEVIGTLMKVPSEVFSKGPLVPVAFVELP